MYKHNLVALYAIYDKYDNIIYSGTGQECADFLGKSMSVFWTIVSKGITTLQGYRIYRVGKYRLESINDNKINE